MEYHEMEEVIKQEGWTVHPLKRRNKGKIYIYAARRGHKHRYIAPASKIESMTREEILAILRK